MDVLGIFKQFMDKEQSRVPTNREIRSKMFLRVPSSIASNTATAVGLGNPHHRWLKLMPS